MYCIASAVDEFFYVQHFGVANLLSHLTHVTLVISTALLLVHSLVDMLPAMLSYSDAARWIKGLLATAGASISSALYCASACLLLVSNGSLSNLQATNNGTWFSVAFVLQHFVPFLVWAPVHAMRCDARCVSWTQRLVGWIAAPPLVLGAYGACLLVLDLVPPVAGSIDVRALVGGGAAFLLPWIAAAFT